MSDWVETYDVYSGMTIAELKELLKARDMPVSGKKKDLIQYLVFDDHPATFDLALDTSIPLVGTGTWLEQKWLDTERYPASINSTPLKI